MEHGDTEDRTQAYGETQRMGPAVMTVFGDLILDDGTEGLCLLRFFFAVAVTGCAGARKRMWLSLNPLCWTNPQSMVHGQTAIVRTPVQVQA